MCCGGALIVDLHAAAAQQRSGVPSLPRAAAVRLLLVEPESIQDGALRGRLREPAGLEAQRTAVVGCCSCKAVVTRVESAWCQRLKLNCDEAVSSFAFSVNVRRYAEEARQVLQGWGCRLNPCVHARNKRYLALGI